MTWPAYRGDHRAAYRSAADGARHGRIAWQVRSDDVVSLLCTNAEVVLAGKAAAVVLDARGEQRARISHADGGPFKRWALCRRTLLFTNGSEIFGTPLDSARGWRLPAKGVVEHLHPSPDGDIVVWTRRSRSGIAIESDLTRYGDDGREVWSVPHAAPPAGYVSSWSLAFDDAGNLYAYARGRMGDGVSGDDIPSGGLAAYDVAGQHLFTAGDGMVRDITAADRGVIAHGFGVRAYDPAGKKSWEEDSDDGPIVSLREVGIELVSLPRQALRDLIVQRGPRSTFHLASSTDGSGRRAFVMNGYVVSLNAELAPDFMLPLAGKHHGTPVVGPASTLLVLGQDGTVTAIA